MARADFDLEELRGRHPRLVICSISGYGETGPYRDMKSYDMLIQAETGLASLTGPAEAPARVGASVTDIAAGLNDYTAILEALIAAEFAGYSRGTLGERLKSVGIAFGNFNTVEDFSHHPHLRRIAVDTPEGPVRLPAAPAVFEEHRPSGRVPALGAHTAAIRAEFAK